MRPLSLLRDGAAVLRAHYYFRSAKKLGSRVRVWGDPVVGNYGNLEIGDRVRISSTLARTEIAVGSEGSLVIGERVFINYGCSIAATKSVLIGARATIGTHVLLMDNDFHCLDPARRDEMPPSRPIIIGENVWLGARVIVLPGVTIGTDTAVGAGSVVTRSLPAGVVAAGVPAKVIRSL